MSSAFSGARNDRLDRSVGVAVGGATPIAVFVPPDPIEPAMPASRRRRLDSRGHRQHHRPDRDRVTRVAPRMDWLDAADPGGEPGARRPPAGRDASREQLC
jgi:hypothetical protein